jgi:UDP-N-acetylglucosamine 2-epimerase (non-hydrolysing)
VFLLLWPKFVKILSIFGTRPEAIKMAPILRELARHSGDGNCQSVTCVTAQHRQMLDQVLRTFHIQADFDLNLMEREQTLASLTARGMTDITSVLRRERPDLVLVQGDTTTAMIAALAAFYERIPIGHVEAGLRTYDQNSPFPEEVNRRIIATLATFHFAPTARAVKNLRTEGITEGVYLTGNTVVDALLWVVKQTPSPDTVSILRRLGLPDQPTTGVDRSDDEVRTILVTAHRRENFGKPFEEICRALLRIVQRNSNLRIVYPVHMNPNVREPVGKILGGCEQICLIEPLSYESFAHVISRVCIVITDSGGVQEEAPALGKPVLVLRNETERPEAVEAGCVRLVGTDQERIVTETEMLIHDRTVYRQMSRVISPYGDGHAAERIVSVITSASAVMSNHHSWPENLGQVATQ